MMVPFDSMQLDWSLRPPIRVIITYNLIITTLTTLKLCELHKCAEDALMVGLTLHHY